MKTTDLLLEYPESSDIPDIPAHVGNLAKKTDELLQAGGVAGHFVSNSELTRASASLGSFSTPIKVSGLRLEAGQQLEISLHCFATASIESTTAVGGKLELRVNGLNIWETGPASITAGTLAVGKWSEIRGRPSAYTGEGWFQPSTGRNKVSISVPYWTENAPVFVDAPEDLTTEVELVGLSTSGTITVYRPRLHVRVWG